MGGVEREDERDERLDEEDGLEGENWSCSCTGR